MLRKITRICCDMRPSSTERIKLIAATLNGVGLGVAGFGVLRPMVDSASVVTDAAVGWSLAGFFALHAMALYALGKLE